MTCCSLFYQPACCRTTCSKTTCCQPTCSGPLAARLTADPASAAPSWGNPSPKKRCHSVAAGELTDNSPPHLKKQLCAFSVLLASYHPSCNYAATTCTISKPAAQLTLLQALLISFASVTLLSFLGRNTVCSGKREFGLLTWESQDPVWYKIC